VIGLKKMASTNNFYISLAGQDHLDKIIGVVGLILELSPLNLQNPFI
jgi:hypothetical protein